MNNMSDGSNPILVKIQQKLKEDTEKNKQPAQRIRRET